MQKPELEGKVLVVGDEADILVLDALILEYGVNQYSKYQPKPGQMIIQKYSPSHSN